MSGVLQGYGGGQCDGRHEHVTLEGRFADGSWATTVAKEYPPGLCKCLGTAIFEAAKARLAQLSGLGEGEDVDSDLAPFVVPLDPYHQVERGAD
eukprot:5526575-Pyramimonas_sp.AAC.1